MSITAHICECAVGRRFAKVFGVLTNTLKTHYSKKRSYHNETMFCIETACIIYLHGNEEGLYNGMNLALAPILHQWKGQPPYRKKRETLSQQICLVTCLIQTTVSPCDITV